MKRIAVSKKVVEVKKPDPPLIFIFPLLAVSVLALLFLVGTVLSYAVEDLETQMSKIKPPTKKKELADNRVVFFDEPIKQSKSIVKLDKAIQFAQDRHDELSSFLGEGELDANAFDGYGFYTVQSGDKPKLVAKKFRMDTNELAVINGFKNGKELSLKVGQRINIIDRRKAPPNLAGTTLSGRASWYGSDFHGKKTASGGAYNMNGISVAHKTLPLGTIVDIHAGGKVVKGVKVNDRGPYVKGRSFDLSKKLAQKLGLIQKGVGPVKVVVKDKIEEEDL